jgi:hypothetical protein
MSDDWEPDIGEPTRRIEVIPLTQPMEPDAPYEKPAKAPAKPVKAPEKEPV